MNRSFQFLSASLLALVLSTTAYAEPPHHGGLPPGLQKKFERGEPLPPGWSKSAAVYEYGYGEPVFGPYGYEESNYDQYEPEYVEDEFYRIIKGARDFIGNFPQ